MYLIVRIPSDAPEFTETLGTKDKFWYDRKQLLFKAARGGTGEDWAEKVCAEIAQRLGIPRAYYDLAEWETNEGGVRGVVSRNFCPPGAALILGNELLSEADPDYTVGDVSKYRVPAHSVDRVLRTLQDRNPRMPIGWMPPRGVVDAVDVFIGYLLLDVLVGNTDRHHENWGVVRSPNGTVHLAPTFDHASSLGCHLTDERKAERLYTADRNYTAAAFAAKARSALYRHELDTRPLLTVEAFLEAARHKPAAAVYWLELLNTVTDEEIAIILSSVPRERISDTAAEFANQLILINKKRSVELKKDL